MAQVAESRFDRTFFERPTSTVARDLIGCHLVSRVDGRETTGMIVETEAYLGANDLASHAAWLRSGREIMAMLPGTIYVFRSYGIHQMFNIVAKETSEEHGAVLIRALEPLSGIDLMRERRGQESLHALCSGPGKLCQALAIDSSLNGRDLFTEPRVLVRAGVMDLETTAGPRIGITKATDLPLRFYAAKSRFLSRQPIRRPRSGEAYQ